MRKRTPDYADMAGGKAGEVDAYFCELLAPQTDALTGALARNVAAGLPAQDVSPLQGKFLQLLVMLTGARRVLEIGTLGGYSAIWMADALPQEGILHTIEVNPLCAAAARANVAAAGHEHTVQVFEGHAPEVLRSLEGPYDLIFIDADKSNNPEYLDWSLKLARRGTVIVGDNVVRGGGVLDPGSPDERIQGIRAFLANVARSPRLTATALQTTGEKGWDGFVIAVVTA